MSLFVEKSGDYFRIIAGVLPASFLIIACASTTPVVKNADTPPPDHVVVGSGTSDDRDVIEKSNDHILQTVGATTPTPTEPAANQGVP